MFETPKCVVSTNPELFCQALCEVVAGNEWKAISTDDELLENERV
jgi:hypothetical protein